MPHKKSAKGFKAPAVVNRDNPRQIPDSQRGRNAPD